VDGMVMEQIFEGSIECEGSKENAIHGKGQEVMVYIV
jgi:hypothetical protein